MSINIFYHINFKTFQKIYVKNMCFIKLCVIKDIFEKNVEFHDIMSK